MKSPFFTISIVLGLIALFVHAGARDQVMKYSHRRAEILSALSKQHELTNQPVVDKPDAESIRLRQNSKILTVAGSVLTVSSLAVLIVAAFRRERGWYFAAIMFLFFGILPELLL